MPGTGDRQSSPFFRMKTGSRVRENNPHFFYLRICSEGITGCEVRGFTTLLSRFVRVRDETNPWHRKPLTSPEKIW